ncbi:Proteinase inhibitor I2 [Aphelenchoides avenae]|nr:Proteinase inhibitor I2 [Aphelenchus avenae]
MWLRACAALTALFSFIAADECGGSRDAGTFCVENAPRRMFYFDGRMGVCQPFMYHGCGGNDENRFNSAKDCRETCAKKSQNSRPKAKSSQWVLAEKCGANHLIPDGEYLPCEDGKKCPDEHACRGGVCCPSKEHVCSLRDDSGTFAEDVADKPRFAWSDEIQSCWRFSYYGAKGNYNNFPDFPSCIAFCSDKH